MNQDLETSHKGIYACGNCLQVYDTVDMLALDAKRCGNKAVSYIQNVTTDSKEPDDKFDVNIVAGEGVRFVIPQKITEKGLAPLTMRVLKPCENVVLIIKAGDKKLLTKKLPYVNPANMIRIELDTTDKSLANINSIEVMVVE